MEISNEFINIFHACASMLSSFSVGQQEILLQCIENTQLSNSVPGASPCSPIKTKTTHFVSRYVISNSIFFDF